MKDVIRHVIEPHHFRGGEGVVIMYIHDKGKSIAHGSDQKENREVERS